MLDMFMTLLKGQVRTPRGRHNIVTVLCSFTNKTKHKTNRPFLHTTYATVNTIQ